MPERQSKSANNVCNQIEDKNSSKNRYRNLTVNVGADVDHDDQTTIEKPDSQQVTEWKKQANRGVASAQCNLGTAYLLGEGVPKDIHESFAWYIKAAKNGLVQAQFNLAHFYMGRFDFQQDLPKAFFWSSKAAQQGYPSSQYNLGIMYINGLGVAKDEEEGISWIKKAALQQHVRATNFITSYLGTESMFKTLKDSIKGRLITEWPGSLNKYSAKNCELADLILSLNACQGEKKLNDALLILGLERPSNEGKPTLPFSALIGSYAGLFKPSGTQQHDQQASVTEINYTSQRHFNFT